jgi:hypothetical protein
MAMVVRDRPDPPPWRLQRPRRYDVVIDIGGNRRLAHLRRALTPRETLVITVVISI